MNRPDPPASPVGHRYVAAPAPGWRAIPNPDVTNRRCRRIVRDRDGLRGRCNETAVAELNRGKALKDGGRADSRWAYCAEHMYGKWVEDGQVLGYRLHAVITDD